MNYQIDIQNACTEPLPVAEEELRYWATLALQEAMDCAELTIRLVDVAEMLSLNSSYRKQNKPTNVLAFPSSIPKDLPLDYPLLGDVIICPEVLKNESNQQNKPLKAHWAHITMHGVLHLLGYDHIEEEQEIKMQAVECKLLANCGFANPYDEEGQHFG